MEWKDLAPWIAIAFTLALSILVPLFTQIANNKHQRKMQVLKLQHEQKQLKIKAYMDFLLDVGAVVTISSYAGDSHIVKAGASLHQLYLYAPTEWWGDLDSLADCIEKTKWNEAIPLMRKLSHLIRQEIDKEQLL